MKTLKQLIDKGYEITKTIPRQAVKYQDGIETLYREDERGLFELYGVSDEKTIREELSRRK